jgi:hypothetical protein
MRRLLWLPVFAFALLLPTRARATAEFPQQMVSDLGISCSNPIWDGSGCTVCHDSNNGGLGTATKPFGVWTKQNGLTPFNDAKLAALLQQLQNESPHTTDTNCDGTPDIDQLENCQWLDLASQNQCSTGGDAGIPIGVYYGCQAAPAVGDGGGPALPASATLAFAGVLAGALVKARRRKRSGDPSRRSSPP